MLSDRRNIVVIVGEAHRTQYGFARVVEEKDEQGKLSATESYMVWRNIYAMPCQTQPTLALPARN